MGNGCEIEGRKEVDNKTAIAVTRKKPASRKARAIRGDKGRREKEKGTSRESEEGREAALKVDKEITKKAPRRGK